MGEEMLAPCGIDCSTCNIRRAKSEPETMKSILDWFKNKRNLELKPEQITCDGCLGDSAMCWSSDCGIRKCSIDDHHYESCSACTDFPCGRLDKWAAGDAGHGKALDRLKKMRAEKQA